MAGAAVGNIPKSGTEINSRVVCIFADDSSHTSIKVSSVGIREGNFCLSLSSSYVSVLLKFRLLVNLHKCLSFW